MLRTTFPVSGIHVDDHKVLHGRSNAEVNAAEFASLDAAMADAVANGVRRVYLPAGTYQASSVTANGLHLYGDGSGATVVEVSGAGPGISFASSEVNPGVRGSLSGVTVHPAAGSTPAGAVYLENARHVELRNLYVYDFATYGIRMYGGRGEAGFCAYNQVVNCKLHNNGTNILLEGGANAGQIIGGAISNPAKSGTGISLAGLDGVAGPDCNLILGVDIYSCATAISLANSSLNSFFGVRMESNTNGFVLDASSHHNTIHYVGDGETALPSDAGQENVFLMPFGTDWGSGPKGVGRSRLKASSLFMRGDGGQTYRIRIDADGNLYSELVA